MLTPLILIVTTSLACVEPEGPLASALLVGPYEDAKADVEPLIRKGYIGETADGFLEIIIIGKVDSASQLSVNTVNFNRSLHYKNNASKYYPNYKNGLPPETPEEIKEIGRIATCQKIKTFSSGDINSMSMRRLFKTPGGWQPIPLAMRTMPKLFCR